MPFKTYTQDIDPLLLPIKLPANKPQRTTLVSAITPAETARRRASAAQAHAVATIQTLVTPTTPPPQTVFTPSDGATEKTSAMDRARATVYRMHPMTAILALLASGLALWLQLGLGLALCIFAATAIAGYGYFNVTDYRYSRAGLERHRISMATQLERERMDHEKQLKTLALQGLLHLHATRPIAYDEGSVIDG